MWFSSCFSCRFLVDFMFFSHEFFTNILQINSIFWKFHIAFLHKKSQEKLREKEKTIFFSKFFIGKAAWRFKYNFKINFFRILLEKPHEICEKIHVKISVKFFLMLHFPTMFLPCEKPHEIKFLVVFHLFHVVFGQVRSMFFWVVFLPLYLLIS